MALTLRSNWLPRTIRTRLLLAALCVEVAMLSLLVTNSLRLQDDNLLSQARVHANQMTPVLAAALLAPLAQQDYATVQAVADESQAVEGIEYVAVVGLDGRTVAISGWDRNQPLPEARATLETSDGKLTRYDVSRPIEMYGQPLGYLRFGLDLTHVSAARHRLMTQGVAIALVEVFLSAALLMGLGILLTRHLNALTHASEEVRRGNLTPTPVAEGDDDIGQLGAAFNAMSRAVAERVHELTDARDRQLQLARAVELERARLQALLEAMDIGVLFADSQGTVLYANPAFSEIWSLPESLPISGRPLDQLAIHLKAHCRDVQDPLAQMLGRHECHLTNGRIITINDYPVVDARGQTVGKLETCIDVTASRRAARQLVEAKEAAESANRAKTAFVASMSHELRTPLNSILGFAELLRDDAQNDEHREWAGLVLDSGRSLLGQLNQLLDIARIEAGRMEVNAMRFATVPLLQEALGLHRQDAAGKSLQLSLETDPALPPEWSCDRTHILQILGHLLSNAVKFTEQGAITVSARMLPGQESIEIRVRDTGIGIAPEHLPRIFNRFEQMEDYATRRSAGAGLGLALVKELVQLLGGRVAVESEVLKGSTFTVVLPFVTPDAAHAETTLPDADRPAQG